jgi:hypothetical protein
MLSLENQTGTDRLSVNPSFFRIYHEGDKNDLEILLSQKSDIIICDQISTQLDDLVKSKNPEIKKPGPEVLDQLKLEHIGSKSLQEYGVWVYYPWNNTLVHILDEDEFVEVRTNRNRYKITREEQQLLNSKKIGIVGLSVGQSIALTIAMERSCGELRLADFDTAELSNLNRLRTGIHNLGLNKTVIAAREIAEIDPFLKVRLFSDGLHKDNMDTFFKDGGNLDLFIEVCDGLDVKIESRFKARELCIPVVMDTNDRGMLDVERFDLEPDRPILHGLADGLDPDNIKDLSNEEKIPYILKMIGADRISTRLKASMLEVEQSINTWPQLASSVVLGGALTTDVSRRILLDQFHDSGRYYVDFEDLIADKQVAGADYTEYEGPAELSPADLEQIAAGYSTKQASIELVEDKLQKILSAAVLAPSGGNAQPWKFLYQYNSLYIFHDIHFSYSLLDFNNLGSYIGFGAMLENIQLAAAELGLAVDEDIFPLQDDYRLIAVLHFNKLEAKKELQYLVSAIGSRVTNRNVSERKILTKENTDALQSIAATIPHARLHLFDGTADLAEFAEILTNTERLRFLNPRGHFDTFVKELRFTQEEIISSGDGLDVGTLNMKPSELAALNIAKDPEAIDFLRKLEQGHGFKKISRESVLKASSIGVISMDGHDAVHFLQGGRAVERVWLEASYRNISFQPVAQIVFMNELLLSPGESQFNTYERQELKNISERFSSILALDSGRYPVFVFRLTTSEMPDKRSLRRSLDKQFFTKY